MAIRLEGTRELAQKFRELKKGVGGSALRASVKKAITPVFLAAFDAIPIGMKEHKTYKDRIVQPGFARESLRIKMWVGRQKDVATAMLGVAPEAFYVLQFIELGTSKYTAQPWLTPLFEKSQHAMLSEVGRELRKRIDRIARKRAKVAAIASGGGE